MKVGKLKKDKRYDSRNNRSLGIQTYGDRNDYPQQVIDVVNASTTGKSCVDVYSKFISGRGFSDEDFNNKILNRHGHTAGYILNEAAKDYAEIGGFALHVNYNAHFKIVEIQNTPIETARFEKFDENRQFHRIALHPDWGRNYTSLFKWRKEDIDFIELFNPNPEKIQKQVDAVGGWVNYTGQIFYFSNQGEKVYPLPKFDNALTDMNTQEGISNVSNRNARNNFLPAGMIADVMNSDESENQENETEKSILEFQGDEEAVKLMYIQVESKEEIPIHIPFEGKNYDRQFDATRKAVREDIGVSFNQPPILRAEDVGSNFGSTAMKEAYNFYNSVTENERMSVERAFSQIFKEWHEQLAIEFSIEPLSYDVEMTLAEELGEKGFEQLMKIIENEKLDAKQKKSMIKILFNLEDERVEQLIPSAA